jgi:hypothetical protein
MKWCALFVVGLACVGGVNLIATARRVPPAPRAVATVPRNSVMRHEQRMAGVLRALREHQVRGVVGYLSDFAAGELSSHSRGMEEYFLTQFALAPWILDAKTTECEWVVANLRTQSVAERAGPGYRVIEDFGNGVALLQRIERAVP